MTAPRHSSAPLGEPGVLSTMARPTVPAMQALDRYPAQTVFTFVDLGPRLITVTHHDAVAGPYHRNGDAILDVQHAFEGSPEQFRAIAKKHGATMLLVCPNMAESTVYRARAPGGFYDQLARGKTFPWLKPLPLPRNDPLRLFRIEYGPDAAHHRPSTGSGRTGGAG